MRRSEFERAVVDEFGDSYGAVLIADLALDQLGGRTARESIDAGVPPREVWLALCAETYVPVERRHGVGRLEPKR